MKDSQLGGGPFWRKSKANLSMTPFEQALYLIDPTHPSILVFLYVRVGEKLTFVRAR
jgi:hypothetical protein